MWSGTINMSSGNLKDYRINSNIGAPRNNSSAVGRRVIARDYNYIETQTARFTQHVHERSYYLGAF